MVELSDDKRERYTNQAQVGLEDALRFHEGPISEEQSQVIEKVKEIIGRGNLTIDDAREIDKILLAVGLDSLP